MPHDPYPWHWRRWQSDRSKVAIENASGEIITVLLQVGGRQRQEANAAIISEAPHMLNLLKTALLYIPEDPDDDLRAAIETLIRMEMSE